VVLEDLHVARRCPLDAEARQFIEAWLASGSSNGNVEPLALAIARRLGAMGHRAAGSVLELETGYFFPATVSRADANTVVLLASEVRWVHGSPGVLAMPLSSGRYRCLDVGVFVGPIALQAVAPVELE
jgi:hypothetical protein